MCAEEVQDEAKICRYCNHAFEVVIEQVDYNNEDGEWIQESSGRISLQKGEKIIFKIAKSPLIYVFPVLLIILGLLLTSGKDSRVFFFFVGFISLLSSIRYVGFVTNKRVVVKKGIIFVNEEEIILEKVESVGLANMLIWQNVTIKGTGGSPILFNYIMNRKDIKDYLSNRK